ncbi:hypothetical protein [Streptomyces sp. 049-1]|uniref:hypothetical protein n=1 Tax=Streptomyces sp. 049-1 TaxID=2789264 RepID=UPI0039810964
MQRNATLATPAIPSADRASASDLPAIIAEAVPTALARAGINLDAATTAALIADTTNRLAAAAETAREHGATTHRCPVYRDCEASGPHHDHYGHNLPGLEVSDTTGETILDAGFAALSSDNPHERRPAVYLRGCDFDSADAVHAKTTELRHMLDRVDALADRVFADGTQA